MAEVSPPIASATVLESASPAPSPPAVMADVVTVVTLPPPVVEIAAPVVEIAAPVVEIAAPVVEIAAPVVEIPAPVVEIAAPVVEIAAPVVEIAAPPVEIAAPAPVEAISSTPELPPVVVATPVSFEVVEAPAPPVEIAIPVAAVAAAPPPVVKAAPVLHLPNGLKFLFGGLAGMGATCFVQPLDLVKNRMQLSGEGGGVREHKTSVHAIRSILKNEGLTGMYSGLSAGLLRQATYTTTRLGVYTALFDKLSSGDKPPNFFAKAGIGMIAGGIGAFVGTPAEISLIRMTSDGRLPPDQRRGYSNVFNALSRITQEEGVLTLWRGCIPTVARAMVVNAAQLASYSQAKQFLLTTPYFSDNIMCHFGASMISGLVTTAASMPVDIAKTRIQNMKVIDGVPEYRGAGDVLLKVIRGEGFFSLWKGFTPYYARLGPHTVLTFIFLEQMNKNYRLYVMKDTSGRGGL